MSERCKNGHLIAEVGRYKNGRCAECGRESNRRLYWKDPEAALAARRKYRQENREELNRRHRERHNHLYRTDPEFRERAKRRALEWQRKNRKQRCEYFRIYRDAKRAEAGKPPRTTAAGERILYGRSNDRTLVAKSESVEFLAEPFRQWLIEKLLRHTPLELSHLIQLSDRRINGKLYDGDEFVRIDSVDRALEAFGEQWMLNDLCPMED